MTNKEIIIIGAGGGGGSKGGGGGNTPTTAEDSLDSTAKVNILDAISEGEIEGFDTARDEGHTQGTTNYNTAMLKDIFINNTPILNKAANSLSPISTDFNFNDIQIDERRGLGSQETIPGFASTSSETSVGHVFDVKDETATRTFTNTGVNRIRVTINIPQLQKFEDDGDIVGSSVNFFIFIAFDGTSFPSEISDNTAILDNGNKADITIEGRTGNLYQRDFIIPLGAYTSSVSIKVKRITDTSATRTINSFTWFSFTEITDDNNPYNDTALVGLKANATSFNSIPKRTYFVRGLKTKIPNTNVVNGIATGKTAGRIIYNTNNWDGTFQAATWNTCPAWALYDLLIDERYGLGLPESSLDKYAFFAVSKYNNELVSDRRNAGTGTVSATWIQTSGQKVGEITTTAVHNLQSGDFVNVTFTSGTSNGNPTNQSYKIETISTTKFRILNITVAASSNLSGNCTFQREGTEARFALNTYINKSFEAYNLINLICSNMRVMPYWSAGTLFLSQDKPTTVSQIFTLANVMEGGFTYEGSDTKARATLVIVKYFDNNQRKVSYVQDPIKSDVASDAAITKYGIVEKQIEAFGVTSSGQASRLARWVRFTEQNLTETVTFTVDLSSGVIVRPGQVIGINDPVKTGIRRGGRISASTNTTITVDDASASDLPANGVSYTRTINVLMPDGSISQRTITDITGSVITVNSAFTVGTTATAPNVNSVWIIETSGGSSAQNIQNSLYRVISVTEEDGIKYKVTALTYNESAYAHVESGADVTFRDATNLNELPLAPASITITERLYKEVTNQNATTNANEKVSNKGKVKVKLIVNWTQVKGVVNYQVQFKKDNGNYESIIVQGLDFELPDVQAGKIYKFKVFALNGANEKSPTPAIATRTTVGKTDPPSNVAAFTATVDSISGVVLSWTENAPDPDNFTGTDVEFKDLDIAYYEIHKVTGGAGTSITDSNFGNKAASTYLTRDQAPDTVTGDFPSATTSYFIKARDDGGRFSTTATAVVATINAPSVIQNVVVSEENGILKITWNPPATNSFAIKNYKIEFNDGSAQTVFVDTTQFSTPLTFTGSSRDFTITPVDIGSNEGTAHTETVSPPQPNAPTNFTHSFTTDSVLLKWTEPASAGALQPPVVGYRIYRNSNFTTEVAQIKGTDFLLPVNNTNFPNRVATYSVAAVYLDPVNPVKGAASTNRATITNLTIALAAAPSVSQTFELDFVILSWTPVNGSLPTLNYGIFDNNNNLIDQTDTTKFKTKANYSSKVFKIAAFSAAYHNAADATEQGVFIGNTTTFTSTVSPPSPPTYIGGSQSNSISLGSEGGLGFVTISFVPPTVNNATQLDLKDFKIIRSSSATAAGINAGNTELEIITDSESFKEEVSWKVADGQTSITKYYYVQARDLLNNLGTALQIAVVINNPSTPPSEGINEVIDNNVLLRWGQPTVNPTNQLKIDHYEIRKHTGNNTDWDTSSALGGAGESITDSRFSVVFETVGAQYTYLIKAYDVAGNASTTPFTALLEVAQPPDFVLNANYNSIFATAFGTYSQSGTTVTVTYADHRFVVGDLVTLNFTSGAASDLNSQAVTSVPSTSTFTVTAFNSQTTSGNVTIKTLTGLAEPAEVDSVAFTNCLKVFDVALNKNVIYLPVATNSNGVGTETWAEHFIGTGSVGNEQFPNITAIINANLSEYLEPAPTSGTSSYEEVFDYGTNLASTKITTLATDLAEGTLGTVTLTSKIQVASGDSGGSFDTGVSATGNTVSRFGVGFQRVKYTTSAVSSAGSLKKITNLNLRIDTKIRNDTGVGTANASDSGGTTVNFNVSFVDVQGIAVTPNTTSAVFAVVDFQDVPNPTSFKVLLYNTSGVRVTGNFTWQCRGT